MHLPKNPYHHNSHVSLFTFLIVTACICNYVSFQSVPLFLSLSPPLLLSAHPFLPTKIGSLIRSIPPNPPETFVAVRSTCFSLLRFVALMPAGHGGDWIIQAVGHAPQSPESTLPWVVAVVAAEIESVSFSVLADGVRTEVADGGEPRVPSRSEEKGFSGSNLW